MILHIVKGDIINQRDILRKLTELQYVRNDLELRRGSYQVKGQVIDIFPGDSEKHAVRVDLFGDEIENIFFGEDVWHNGGTLNQTPGHPEKHDLAMLYTHLIMFSNNFSLRSGSDEL